MVLRRNRPTKRRTNNRRARNTRSIRKYINGGMRNVGPNPRPITYDPWNSLTLQWSSNSDGTDTDKDFTVMDIDLAIRNQLDIPPPEYYPKVTNKPEDVQKFRIIMKLISVSVHDISNEPVGVSIYDLSAQRTNSNQELSTPFTSVWDYPGRNSWASVKAVYPAYMQRTPIMFYDKTSGGQVCFRTLGKDKSFKHLITVRLLWKSAMELGDIIRSTFSSTNNSAPGESDDNMEDNTILLN